MRNALRSEKDQPVYRDQLLDAWGLHNEATRFRRLLEAHREKQSSDELINIFKRFKKEP